MTTAAYRRRVISDHAVVRYMERKHGADFDIVRREMMTEMLESALAVGASSLTHDGVKYIIAGGKVVTVYPA